MAFQSVYLSGPVVWKIADYAGQHYSLFYRVAALEAPGLAEMIEKGLPARRRYPSVPRVLVGNKPSQPLAVASLM